jgi:outer membrane lipoprotein
MLLLRRFSLVLIFFLAACSGLPKRMQSEPYTKVGLRAVQADLEAFKKIAIRWGGTIISVSNKEGSSQAQLLFYPLNSFGRPSVNRVTEGRFMITGDEFLDPAIYKKGAEVTVAGTLVGKIKQKVGEKNLVLPLIAVKQIHLWPELQRYDDRYSPYFPHYYNPYHYPHSRFGYDFYYGYY